MKTLSQSPHDRRFLRDPYRFYRQARTAGPFFRWEELDVICTTSYAAANAILRDRRFGREVPAERRAPVPPHLAPFAAVEEHSMLELEPPRHTRLRNLVLRAFTTRRLGSMQPQIARLAHGLIDDMPGGPFDLLPAFSQRLPITLIARLIGIPETLAPELLRWSSAMVAVYQAGRNRQTEERAAEAAAAFSDFLRLHIADRRDRPADDLLTHLIAAEADGQQLSTDEIVSTCILILNAGHEAAVHAIGNAVATLLQHRTPPEALAPARIAATVEEMLRFDPPLHLFRRIAYAPVEIMGRTFAEGEEVALLLAAANRDPGPWERPDRFLWNRPEKPHLAFGAGLHFCLGAALARLELATAVPILFTRLPGLHLVKPPRWSDSWHFRGLERLIVAP
ncbi:cytochrome P450 [Cereibacter azotoformans]|uniref:Unspecific monooxygenase n=1 Tax=Cereibacter azotoformans TaxID=43057 RepID=A0A2T5KEX1_9RHOB|nr:cytochrome P450 [Cereibacter azotoformans]AXQ92605.1 cytochrome P450 [Cereibacter sphaeroides]MBO4169814.1 cytochrome P450 [Cereibacter azotoformans]PTR20927.1 unspecific monooxygenase [Cereibacter azotoformans]UIJ30881.1 cytochrome P450 [Cereibacter azotoformans]